MVWSDGSSESQESVSEVRAIALGIGTEFIVENPESLKTNIVENCVKSFSSGLIFIRRMMSSFMPQNGAGC